MIEIVLLVCFFAICICANYLIILSAFQSDKHLQNIRKVLFDSVFQQYEKSYSISAYYDRIEKVSAEILESQKPVDKSIILWWGLDGLRLNEDGTSEWISRKKPSPISQIPRPSYISLSQGIENARYNTFDLTMCCQSTPSQIKELQARNTAISLQVEQNKLNVQICCRL